MSLAAGTRLGPYAIVSPIGAGGMGEVYRARDTRLDRDVAVKVLPAAFASDPDRVARFEREAKAIAALSHPNILAIFDTGAQASETFVVTELLEGETLRGRLTHALPVRRAIDIAIQIARGLAAAHSKAIVHRDLKPENVFLTKDGHVKILDFGLARQIPTSTGATETVAVVTDPGTVLGTVGYMAPEQVRGQAVDARADLFALGAVLYEMLSGRRAFARDTPAETLTAILREEPAELSAGRADLPSALDRIVRHCLEKHASERFGTARDVAFALDALSGSGAVPAETQVQRPRWGHVPTALASAAVTFAVCGIAWWAIRPPAEVPQSTHLPIAAPPGTTFRHNDEAPRVAIFPDGRRIVFATSSDRQGLFYQDLNTGSTVRVPGTDGAHAPAVSPNGESIAFIASDKLQTVSLAGGSPITLAGASGYGAAWSPDSNTIYFVPSADSGIASIPARSGSTPVTITTPKRDGYDIGHFWPEVLPGGHGLIYTSCCGKDRIVVRDLQSGKETVLFENASFARYLPVDSSSGYLLFMQGEAVMAARFDPQDFTHGNPVAVLEDVVIGHERFAEFAVAPNGSLAHYSGVSDTQRQLVRISRDGRDRTILTTDPKPLSYGLSFTRGGDRLAGTFWERQQDIQVFDLGRGQFERVTLDPHNDWDPIWGPDDQSVTFASNRLGTIDLYVQKADKDASARLLWSSTPGKWATSWSEDGKYLAFDQVTPGAASDIWIYSSDSRDAKAFRNQPEISESNGQFSPNGNWIAFQANSDGPVIEIYVAPYPGPGRVCRISRSGGTHPRWSKDGRELVYQHLSEAWYVDLSSGNPCAARPVLMEGVQLQQEWAISPKGDFFVTFLPHDPPQLHVILNWLGDLRRQVDATSSSARR